MAWLRLADGYLEDETIENENNLDELSRSDEHGTRSTFVWAETAA